MLPVEAVLLVTCALIGKFTCAYFVFDHECKTFMSLLFVNAIIELMHNSIMLQKEAQFIQSDAQL